jgi:DNA-binding CsgD family transcriptional regulator
LVEGASSPARPVSMSEHLNENEDRAMNLFAKGFSRVEIAAQLGLSVSTVGHLLTSAKDKLHAKTLPHAVMLHVTTNSRRCDEA